VPINCEIPTLYFVVVEKDDGGGYVSSCVTLLLDGYGATVEAAIDSMSDSIGYFLYESFKDPECRDSAWENIAELFKSSPLADPLWEAYRMFQLELAKNGQATDRCSALTVSATNNNDYTDSEDLQLRRLILGGYIPEDSLKQVV
jgi:hypothetical protein